MSNRFTDEATFNWDDFKNTVKICTRAMDDIIDENLKNHPLKEQQENVAKWRNIGMGIMGLGSALITLKIKYGDSKAIEFSRKLMKEMLSAAVEESIELAKVKGSFPGYSDKIWDSNILKLNLSKELIDKGRKYGLRNCSLLSIAPCGSISTMLGEKYGGEVSGGCEPFFAFKYKRTTKSLNGENDKTYDVYVGLARDYMDKFKTKTLPDYFVSSENISWKNRIDMQAALQDACDTAISSTVNLPEGTSTDEIEKLYLYAWEKGLKGITIFVSGCKRTAILSSKTDNSKPGTVVEQKQNKPFVLSRGDIISVDTNCVGLKRDLQTGCGTLHAMAYFDGDSGDLLEVYLAKGSAGGCNQFMVGLSRMISLAARGGISIYDIIDQLKSSGTCPSYAVRKATKKDTSLGSSCPVAIANSLLDMYNEMQSNCDFSDEVESVDNLDDYKDITPKIDSYEKCPECGSELVHETGCVSCKSCGFSKCD